MRSSLISSDSLVQRDKLLRMRAGVSMSCARARDIGLKVGWMAPRRRSENLLFETRPKVHVTGDSALVIKPFETPARVSARRGSKGQR